MRNKQGLLFLAFLAIACPCFAGGLKGNIIDEDMVIGFVLVIVVLHLVSIAAFLNRITWLRIVCAILYLPVFLIPLVLTLLVPGAVLLFIPFGLFYFFVIVRSRNEG